MKTSICNSAIRILLFVVLLATGGRMWAETVTADFNNGLPEGWTMVGNLYNDSDRARSGKGIYTYSKQDKTNYILTTEMEGDIEFYGRSYNTKGYGYITFYTVNDDNTLGDKLHEFRTDNVSSGKVSFQKFTYTLDMPRRIAIDLYWSCIDDFTYTPAQTAAEASLSVTDFISGSSYDFGGVPMSAGTTHTFTLVNKGAGDLTISSIDVTGGFTLTEGSDLTGLAPKSSATLTVATPAADAEGVLTITSNDPDSPYTIHLSSTYKVPMPVMSLSTTSVDFGKVTEVTTREVSVSNTGDAELIVEISSDTTVFSVSPAMLSVAPGETEAFTVTYNYDANVFGTHTGTLTVTPNAGEAASIALSAKVRNPQGWFEDFSSNTLPEGWEAGNLWTFADGVAKASYNYSDKDSRLTTPPLTVVAGDELTFSYKATASFVTIKILASRDGGEYFTLASIGADWAMADFDTYTISGLQPGSYRFSFVNDDYELDDFEGFMLDMNAPKMEVYPVQDALFGKVTERPEAITYTVANNGTGKMTVAIASDSEYFTVTPSTLTNIEKGEPKTFTVNFEYNIEDLGEKNGTITIMPTYNEEAKVTFSAQAIAKNPDIWEEDFENGIIPADWENEGEWNVSTPFVSGSNGTQMAVIRSLEPKALTTPRLKANEGAELAFYIGMQFDDEALRIEYSADKTTWKAIDSETDGYTESGKIVFKAPADGYYYIRFTGTYAMLDDFEGFKYAPKVHDLVSETLEIPDNGHQFIPYTASVTVRETYGQTEEASARLLVNGEEVASAEAQEIAPNGTATFTMSFLPTEAMENAEVQIEVVYAEELLTTDVVMLTVAPAPVIDENESSTFEEGILPAAVVRYNAINGWNTIAMPFALTDELLARLFGENYEIFEFDRFADNMIEFRTPTDFVAGRPYVVYTQTAAEHDDLILYDVHIEAAEALSDGDEEVMYSAYYAPEAPEDMENVYLLDPVSESPELCKATGDDFGKGLRGYLRINHTDPLPILKLGEYLAIRPVCNGHNDRTAVYDLNGIRLSVPAQRGICIINGKKVFLK
ncbi:MAG: choice-of-anchor D domain-containing protein [Bacteroidaceae bacterium]|nr:choice-of-anchor D domain-containing protein [Bacteroidaceae bacterium]